MLKKIEIFTVFIVLICGIQLIYMWNSRQHLYKEGNTLEEIGRDDLSVGEYVSFYIDDYINKETHVYLDVEYEIYTILIERKTSESEDIYIQVMVKDQETKQKLENKGQNKVYFQGEVISAPAFSGFEFNKDLFKNTDEVDYFGVGKLILNEAIIQTEVPDEDYNLYVGIALVILALIGYRMFGGIESCVPDVEIKPNKFTEYSFEHAIQTYNIRNDYLCEKDNLKNLQAEQNENKKVCNIMIVVFIVGLIIYFSAPVFYVKIFGFIPMYIGIGGIWSRFINSSHKLAVYIAKRRGKRSIYLEIEECKKNIELLEKIMDKKNLQISSNQFNRSEKLTSEQIDAFKAFDAAMGGTTEETN